MPSYFFYEIKCVGRGQLEIIMIPDVKAIGAMHDDNDYQRIYNLLNKCGLHNDKNQGDR